MDRGIRGASLDAGDPPERLNGGNRHAGPAPMNFDFSEEQKLLRTTAHDYLEDRAPLGLARSILESDATMSRELWAGVAEMGWLGAVIPESWGGGGFGHAELALIAEELGRTLAPIPFVTSAAVAEAILLAGTGDQKDRYLPGFASGDRIGTLALAEGRGVVRPENVRAQLPAGGALTGTKIGAPDGASANLALVLARDDADRPVLALAELEGVARTAEASIDPSRPSAGFAFDNSPAEPLGGEDEDGWSLLRRVLDRAAVLASFEQLGTAQRAFDLTREQILDRHAFGRPIGSFQAIKHRMADLYATLEIARSNCWFAAWALANDDPGLALAACTARVAATEACIEASVEMVQLFGGAGFTWELDCHLFYRRARNLALALGPAAEWRDRLVDCLSADPGIGPSAAAEPAAVG